MVLTKDDLFQIEQIVIRSEDRIKNELREELVSRVDFKKEVRKIWREVRFLREGLNATIDQFDRRLINVEEKLFPRFMS